MPFKNKIIPVVSIIWEILYTLVQRRLVHDLVTEAFFWTYLCKDVLVFDNVLVGCQEDVELATPQLGDQGAAHGRGALSGEGERHTHTLPCRSTLFRPSWSSGPWLRSAHTCAIIHGCIIHQESARWNRPGLGTFQSLRERLSHGKRRGEREREIAVTARRQRARCSNERLLLSGSRGRRPGHPGNGWTSRRHGEPIGTTGNLRYLSFVLLSSETPKCDN